MPSSGDSRFFATQKSLPSPEPPKAASRPKGAIGFMATTPLRGGSLCNFCMVVREKVVPTLRVGTVSFITIELPYYLRSI